MTNKQIMSLKKYIERNYHYDEVIQKELEHEVTQIWSDVHNRLVPYSEHIEYFGELSVEGYDLDAWIDTKNFLFNTSELSDIIFKLWSKEIVLK